MTRPQRKTPTAAARARLQDIVANYAAWDWEVARRERAKKRLESLRVRRRRPPMDRRELGP